MLKPLRHLVSGEPPNADIRTEDIRFSPSGRILAAVATSGCVVFCQVEISGHAVRIRRSAEFTSPSLNSPHGVDFVSEDIIAVANRMDGVSFFRIPDPESWDDTDALTALDKMQSKWFGETGATRDLRNRTVSTGPGSIRVHDGELLVCCNKANTVTAHPFQLRNGAVETGEERLIVGTGIEIPDGVAVTRDGRWMAVSDHDHQRVLVYRRQDGAQTCELRDPALNHPHGLCFDPTGRRLYVADAGGRDLHVFSSERHWNADASRSVFKIAAVEADTFHKTREETEEQFRALEGGIKGVDIDPSGRVLVTTCRRQTVRFFQIRHTLLERVLGRVSLVTAPFAKAPHPVAATRPDATTKPFMASSSKTPPD